MPYYKNKDINLLFIHIPKTGGTSVDKYFLKKYNVKWNNNSLHTLGRDTKFNNHVLQHVTYQNIIDNNCDFKIDFNNLKIISITRNPYDRTISALFYNNVINKNTTEKDVYQYIKHIIDMNICKNIVVYDNHFLPQYQYLWFNNKLIDNVTLLKTEYLDIMMHNIGYTDFNSYENINKSILKKDYYKFINKDTLDIINEFYKKDFELFDYKMLSYNDLIEIKSKL
jgi:hypothetical protein